MSSTVSLNSNALITSRELFDMLSVKETLSEDKVNEAINTASDLIEGYLNRKPKAANYYLEEHVFDRVRPREGLSVSVPLGERDGSKIFVRNYPIREVLKISTQHSLKEQSGTTTSSGSTTQLNDTTLSEAADFWQGANLAVTLSAALVESRVVSVSASAGVLTVEEPFSQDVGSASTYKLTLKDTSQFQALSIQNDAIDYDFDIGRITMNGTFRRLLISYRGGFTTIPSAIKRACAKQVQEELKTGKVGAIARTLGGESHSYNNPGTDSELLLPDVRMLLNRYKRRIV